jgi:hypothetical protein
VPNEVPPIRTAKVSERRDKLLSFGGSAAALGIAAVVARVACPGGCAACTGCAQSVVPAVASAAAVGSALAGSMMLTKRRSERLGRSGGEESSGE